MVEWKKLGEICELERGVRVIKKDLQQEGLIPVYQNSLTPLGYFDKSNYPECTPFVICAGAAGEVGFCSKPFWAADDCTCILCSSLANKKYIYYCLLVNQHTLKSQVRKASVPRLSKDVIGKLVIPIPSLEEQARIVGILDTFTASIDNLKEQIAQRRKQYEYYRDQLLDLEGKEGVEMKYITDVAKSFTGLTYKPEHVSDSGTLVLRSSNIKEDVLSFDDNVYVQMLIPERAKVHENDILICVRNGSKRLVGKSAMITKEAEGMAFGAFMTILRSFAINSKFLFYVWQSDKVRKQYKGDEAMPIAQITAKDFQRIEIPIPSLQDQQRIVSILDKFEASIKNLEAQLSQREKQYEYYRNKLLTFE